MTTSETTDAAEDRDVEMVTQFMALIRGRSLGNYLAAADAHRQLEQLVVKVHFPRKRKAKGEAT